MKPIFRSGVPAATAGLRFVRILAGRSLQCAAQHIRQLGAWIFGCYAWLLFGLIMLSFGSVAILLQRPLWTRPLARCTARLLFRLAWMPLSARGIERLPREPHLLLVNHTSFLDGLVLTALLPARPGYAFTVKQQYRSQAVLWPLLKGLGTILLSHTMPGQRSANVDKLAAALRTGQRLLVFPEGRIDPEAGLRQFHSGTFIAAAQANVPVVVAALRGTRKALPLGTWLPHRAAIHLEIGATMTPVGNDSMAAQQLHRAAHQAMAPLTGESDCAPDDPQPG